MFKSIHRYLSFLDIIKKFDIIITNFDGGFLRYTNLKYLEHFFLKISLKKLLFGHMAQIALYIQI